jgi:hypothetical protein
MDQRGSRAAHRARGAASLPRALHDGVLATDVGDEIVVYHSKDHRGHCLNRPAAVIWRHLDGRTSMAEMVERLEQELTAPADEDMVWLALKELDRAHLLEGPLELPAERRVSRRSMLQRMGAAAGAGAILLPAISTVVAPPAHAQTSAVGCSPPDTCASFTCPGGCACVPTTEGSTVCIVPTCVAPCTTTSDCPPGTVCFTLGCCGPATFCVPIAPAGTNCQTAGAQPWQNRRP